MKALLVLFYSLLFKGRIKPYEKSNEPKPCCTRKKMIIVIVILVMLLLYALGLGIGLAVGLTRDKEESNSSHSEVKVAIGAVVTDHEACSQIGR